jgi:hypothetical protein
MLAALRARQMQLIASKSERLSGVLGSSDAFLSMLECRGWPAKTPCPRVSQHIPHGHFLLEKC